MYRRISSKKRRSQTASSLSHEWDEVSFYESKDTVLNALRIHLDDKPTYKQIQATLLHVDNTNFKFCTRCGVKYSEEQRITACTREDGAGPVSWQNAWDSSMK